jgi:hypothetical protein
VNQITLATPTKTQNQSLKWELVTTLRADFALERQTEIQ